MNQSLYDVLGVEPTADAKAIKAAYKRRARESHPDRPGGSAAAMAEITAAYSVLGDELGRLTYDRTGKTRRDDPAALGIPMVLGMFQKLLESDAPGNYLHHIRKWLNQERNAAQQIIDSESMRQRQMDRKLARVRAKKGGKLFASMQVSMKKDVYTKIDAARIRLKTIDEAFKIVEQYEWEE